MALFQKKPTVTSSAPLYTVSSNKTLLVIGLGNVGRTYEGTRHNIGFAVLDYFAHANEFPAWVDKRDLKSQITAANLGDRRVILAKPTTLMNNSGEAVQAIQHFYKLTNADSLVVYDELAIGFGQIRTRVGGSDAGHNGVKSLIAHAGEDFSRVRIGIGNDIPEKADAANFVLGKFSKEEQAALPAIYKESAAIITEFVFGGKLPHETRTIL